jgi:hypothetical protein
MRQRFVVVEHRTEVTHIEPTAARFAFVKVFGLAQWRSARLFTDDCPPPRGIIGVMRASLVILAARVDRDLDFVVTGMLNGEQDASIRFVGDPP